MDDFTSFERETIRVLFASSDWIDIFVLHERYMLSPGQLSHAVRKLAALNVIDVSGLNVRLNSRGRKWVFVNRRMLFMRNEVRFWASRHDPTQHPSISPATPYMPKLKAVRTDFFKKIDAP
jgi:hypothetical protein